MKAFCDQSQDRDIWIGPYLNGHVGGTRTRFEREHAGDSGEIDTPKVRRSYILHNLMGNFFQKKIEHLITYKSGGRRSVIDYILIRRNNISKVKDCKMIPGKSVATQHRIITMDICTQTNKRVKSRRIQQQIKRSNGGD